MNWNRLYPPGTGWDRHSNVKSTAKNVNQWSICMVWNKIGNNLSYFVSKILKFLFPPTTIYTGREIPEILFVLTLLPSASSVVLLPTLLQAIHFDGPDLSEHWLYCIKIMFGLLVWARKIWLPNGGGGSGVGWERDYTSGCLVVRISLPCKNNKSHISTRQKN